MLDHPQAPRWNLDCGDQLDARALAWVRSFQAGLRAPRSWPPAWLEGFQQRVLAQVPHYRGYLPGDIPLLEKEVFREAVWSLVPDDEPLEDLLTYGTSGTSGTRVLLPTAPRVAGATLALFQYGLELHGVDLTGGPDQVAMLQVSMQGFTKTYALISTFLDQAGFVKINLNPDEWRKSRDRVAFIDACRPQVITGDPLTFAELRRLPLKHSPKALISSGMTMLGGLRRELEAHFGCPVLDIYSMSECPFIGLKRDEESGYRVVAPDLFVEALEPSGEIVLTGGRNPFLPLLRYRTHDHARLRVEDGTAFLHDLDGRTPVTFQKRSGERFNSVDVTHSLEEVPVLQFSLHQFADGSLAFRYRGKKDTEKQVRAVLEDLFGGQRLAIEAAPMGAAEKWIQYTSD